MKFKQQIAPHLLDEENSVKYTEPTTLDSLSHKFIISKAEVILGRVDHKRPVTIQAPKVVLKNCSLKDITIYTSELYIKTSILEDVKLKNVEKLVGENSKLTSIDLQLFEERRIPELILKKSTLYFKRETKIDSLISFSSISTFRLICKSWTHNNEHIFTEEDYFSVDCFQDYPAHGIAGITQERNRVLIGIQMNIFVNLTGEKIVVDSIEFLAGYAPNALQVIEYFKKKNIYFKKYFLVDRLNHSCTTKIEFNPFA